MTTENDCRLTRRLAAGDIVLIDGGTGTEVEALGGETVAGLWSGAMAIDHPDLLRRVHRSYIDAGAEMIIANTYASSRHLLERAGLGDKFDAVNRRSVEIAREAVASSGRADVSVAGSLSPTEMMGEVPDLDERRAGWFEQAAILADAGAELIVLEMLRDTESSEAIIEAALSTGLPVWAGFSCHLDDEGTPIMFNRTETLAEGLRVLGRYPIDAVLVMHTEVEAVDACLDIVQSAWEGPVGVYAHVGGFANYVWEPDPEFTPAAHTAYCNRWIDRGVTIIGGCCGIGPEHIADLGESLSRR